MSKKSFKFNDIPVDWGDHLPDGDYTIGRGADPRGETKTAITSVKSQQSTKPPAQAANTKSLRKLKVPSTSNLQRRRKIVGA